MVWSFKTRHRQAARTPVPPKSLERSPTEPQGEKAKGTEESRALHTSERNTAIVNARSASVVPLHRMLRGHFIVLHTTPFPTLHPSRSSSGGGRQTRVSAAPQSPRRVPKAALGLAAACCRGFCFLLHPFIIASHRGDRNCGERGREWGRQRQGERVSEKEAGGGKESFKLRREMEANF